MKRTIVTSAVIALLSICVVAEPEYCHGAKRVDGSAAIARIVKYVPVQTQSHMIQQVGIVVVRNVVGSDGKVSNLRMISGHPLLIGLALDALHQWEYQPWKQSVCFDLRVPVRNDRPTTRQEVEAENVTRPK
jgi:hypothetical protein